MHSSWCCLWYFLHGTLCLVGVWVSSLMVKPPWLTSPFSVAVLCLRSLEAVECQPPGGSWAGTPWSHSLSLPLGGGFPPFPPQGWESHWAGICSSPLHCPSSFRCQPPVFWSHKGNQLHACHAGSSTWKTRQAAAGFSGKKDVVSWDWLLKKDVDMLEWVQRRLLRSSKDWSTSAMRKGWRSWGCSS